MADFKKWLVLVAAVLVGGALIFGSLLWFVAAHLGQIFGFILLFAIVNSIVKNNGVNDGNKWLIAGLIAVALVLLFVPLNFISGLREMSVARALPKAATILGLP